MLEFSSLFKKCKVKRRYKISITTNIHEILKKNIYSASLLNESVSWNMAVK